MKNRKIFVNFVGKPLYLLSEELKTSYGLDVSFDGDIRDWKIIVLVKDADLDGFFNKLSMNFGFDVININNRYRVSLNSKNKKWIESYKKIRNRVTVKSEKSFNNYIYESWKNYFDRSDEFEKNNYLKKIIRVLPKDIPYEISKEFSRSFPNSQGWMTLPYIDTNVKIYSSSMSKPQIDTIAPILEAKKKEFPQSTLNIKDYIIYLRFKTGESPSLSFNTEFFPDGYSGSGISFQINGIRHTFSKYSSIRRQLIAEEISKNSFPEFMIPVKITKEKLIEKKEDAFSVKNNFGFPMKPIFEPTNAIKSDDAQLLKIKIKDVLKNCSLEDFLKYLHNETNLNIYSDYFISDFELNNLKGDIESYLGYFSIQMSRIFTIKDKSLLCRSVNYFEEVYNEPDYPIFENAIMELEKNKNSGKNRFLSWGTLIPILGLEPERFLKIALYENTAKGIDFSSIRNLLDCMNSNSTYLNLVKLISKIPSDILYSEKGVLLKNAGDDVYKILKRDNFTRNALRFNVIPVDARIKLEVDNNGVTFLVLFIDDGKIKNIAQWLIPVAPVEGYKNILCSNLSVLK